MGGRSVFIAIALVCATSLQAGVVRAQITLADDVIAASQAKRVTEKRHASSLGRSLRSAESPYRRRPESADVNLGGAAPRRASLPRLARLPTGTSAFRT